MQGYMTSCCSLALEQRDGIEVFNRQRGADALDFPHYPTHVLSSTFVHIMSSCLCDH